MLRPVLPEAEILDGSEMTIIRKGNKPFRTLLSRIVSSLVPGLRVERFTAATNAQGVVAFTFPTPFKTTPDLQVITGWASDQMLSGAVISASATGCTAQLMVSQGTLLIGTAPFKKAGQGLSVTVRAIGY